MGKTKRTSDAIVSADRPPRISEMSIGQFWSRTIIGGTPEDHAACDRGELPRERAEALVIAAQQAIDYLAETPVPNWNEWKPHRLLVN